GLCRQLPGLPPAQRSGRQGRVPCARWQRNRQGRQVRPTYPDAERQERDALVEGTLGCGTRGGRNVRTKFLEQQDRRGDTAERRQGAAEMMPRSSCPNRTFESTIEIHEECR